MAFNTISSYKDSRILYNHAVVTPENLRGNFDMHSHDICELIYIIKGNVSGYIGAKEYKYPKGSLVIFRANIPHKILINDDSAYERYNILFDEKILANKIFDEIPEDIDVINISGNNFIEELFRKLDYYCKNFSGKNLKILINHIVEEIVFNITLFNKEDTNKGLMSVNNIINQAVEYIEDNYTNDITLDDICKKLFVNRSHLHHLFNEYIQMSPKKYINSKRLAKARNLLRTGIIPTEAYHMCGFSDYATFYRNYVSNFGYPPSLEEDMEIKRKIYG